MTVKTYYLDTDGNLKVDINRNEIVSVYQSGQGLLWIDIEGDKEEDISLMSDIFGFHKLSIDDCLGERINPPKVDEFENHIFVILHGINHTIESAIVQTTQLELFIGSNYVVSHHTFPVLSTQEIKRLVEESGRPMKRGADFLAHEIADALIDNVLPTIDSMNDVADDIEEEAIHNPQKTTLEAILKLKRSTMQLHRVMAPQREILNRLSRREFHIITQDAQIYFRDIYDHLVRIEDLNQGIRDRTDNSLSTYMSSVANRQNETMKVLSVVAAIFLPLSLLAGIYGMNFEYMPELSFRWGYFAVLGLMGVAIVSVFWWLWLKNIISVGRKRMTFIRPIKVDHKKLLGHIDRIARENLDSWKL
ncbi:magnesium/cobalt transporter CorA [Chloroflexota bacterium]